MAGIIYTTHLQEDADIWASELCEIIKGGCFDDEDIGLVAEAIVDSKDSKRFLKEIIFRANNKTADIIDELEDSIIVLINDAYLLGVQDQQLHPELNTILEKSFKGLKNRVRNMIDKLGGEKNENN
ncbi:MAG: hypothetical protein LBL65_05705 [Campylobacteraceae bacterium]|jgi:hypothetical protein|nr:hypothetical protein [Campylobacteraceae bacterium]